MSFPPYTNTSRILYYHALQCLPTLLIHILTPLPSLCSLPSLPYTYTSHLCCTYPSHPTPSTTTLYSVLSYPTHIHFQPCATTLYPALPYPVPPPCTLASRTPHIHIPHPVPPPCTLSTHTLHKHIPSHVPVACLLIPYTSWTLGSTKSLCEPRGRLNASVNLGVD